MTDSAQPIEAILRDAGIVWEPGMLTVWGDRVLEVDGASICLSSGSKGVPRWEPGADHVPALTDLATYALCLAQLARRLGLDPGRGAVLSPAVGIERWIVDCDDDWRKTAIHTDLRDHRRALALALRATASKETT